MADKSVAMNVDEEKESKEEATNERIRRSSRLAASNKAPTDRLLPYLPSELGATSQEREKKYGQMPVDAKIYKEPSKSHDDYLLELTFNINNQQYGEYHECFDALYKYGKHVFDLIIQNINDDDLNQHILDSYMKVKWDLHSIGTIVVFAEPDKLTKKWTVGIVQDTRIVPFCYSWEVEHIKNEKIRLIDYKILKNDTIVLIDNIDSFWISSYDVRKTINFDDTETSGKQSLASALGYQERNTIVESELEVCFLILYICLFF